MKIPFLKLHRGPSSRGFRARATRTRAVECDSNSAGRPLNPEDKIFRLEADERGEIHRRKSHATCSDDVVAEATNALKECPRFSLDGRDAKYQYSFRSPDTASSFEEKLKKDGFDVSLKNGHSGGLPPPRASGSPLWCKPSVVGTLMGLDAMPIPVRAELVCCVNSSSFGKCDL